MDIHKSDTKRSCDECGKTYCNSQVLKCHKLTHSRVMTNTSNSYEEHSTTKENSDKSLRVNADERPHECLKCGKHFRNKQNLKNHNLSVHENQKPHECPICKKAFTTKGNLNKHQLVHTDEKPHECLDCGQRFRSKSCLSSHDKVIHKKLKPH